MNTLLTTYTVMAAILAGIISEEVRDPRNLHWMASIGLTIIGAVLAGLADELIPPAVATLSLLCLAVAAIFTAASFYYELRKLTKIERDAIVAERRCHDRFEHNSALSSSAKNLLDECEALATALTQISEETEKSIGVVHIGS